MSLIQSRLHYDSFVYMSAVKSILKSLTIVHNSALRIWLGALRSSPTQSLYWVQWLPLWLLCQNFCYSSKSRLRKFRKLKLSQILTLLVFNINLLNNTPTSHFCPSIESSNTQNQLTLTNFSKCEIARELLKRVFLTFTSNSNFKKLYVLMPQKVRVVNAQ